MSLIAELKQRKVFKIGAAYLVVAWLAVQAASIGFPAFGAPPWALRIFILAALLGFPIVLVLAWAFDVTSEGVTPAARSRRSWVVMAVAGGCIALAFAWYFLGQPSYRTSAEAPSSTARNQGGATPDAAPINDKSIAVLAFTDLSPGKDQEYFSDGIAEEILNALVKVEDLKVAGRTSSFSFKGRNEDMRTIGKTLGVAHILEGSVRKQGDKVRITAQLVRAKDGFHLWSETYDGDLQDVFTLQENIAQAITEKLQVILQGEQKTRLVQAGTENTEAYALYLQASRIFNRREGARYDDAIAMLEQAIALDPGYARAHSRLAAIHAVYGNYRSGKSTTARRMVEQHARRASELDPTLAEPYAALGNSLNQNRRFLESRKAFERALQLDPNDVTANFWQGTQLITTGYIREGNAALDRTLALDPLLPNALLWRGNQHVFAGELEQGERLLKRAAEVGHVFVGIGQSRLDMARGDKAAAIASLTKGLAGYFTTAFPPDAPGVFARSMHGDAQARQQATAMIDAYLATRPETIDGIVPYVLIGSGEVGRGLQLAQDRPTSNESLYMFEMFRRDSEVNGAPGFPEFARRSGLAGLWDSVGPPDYCRKNAEGDYTCG